MRAVYINNPGPDSELQFVEQPMPEISADEILIKVAATAVNRADLMQRAGKYPPPAGASAIPGLEVAGEVVKIGHLVTDFQTGDRVYGLVSGGGYAEYCPINQHLACKIPNDWSFVYAAAIPEALTTVHAAIFMLGNLQSGQNLLVHAAGSGISCMAIQMAVYCGAFVYTTASNQQKIAKAEALGAGKVINYKEDDFESIIGANQADLILDFIGGNYFGKHLTLLKPLGRLIQIACMQGHKVECDLALLMRKRLQINGFVLRSQSTAEKVQLWQSAHQRWFSALAEGKIKPVIDSVYSLEDVEEAHQRMKGSQHFGKIVVQVGL
ncbi:NAD(P)H-quinone oxidoreductase [Legionella dresdenensis]|uniref:NAD(P)H-quinone oxidoreductase n=1 Tax=Legionella dresdenensis TaxID=450200 RepID=A0ABV8CC65_9GAMM